MSCLCADFLNWHLLAPGTVVLLYLLDIAWSLGVLWAFCRFLSDGVDVFEAILFVGFHHGCLYLDLPAREEWDSRVRGTYTVRIHEIGTTSCGRPSAGFRIIPYVMIRKGRVARVWIG
jgi:hypothetical protein